MQTLSRRALVAISILSCRSVARWRASPYCPGARWLASPYCPVAPLRAGERLRIITPTAYFAGLFTSWAPGIAKNIENVVIL